MIKKIATLVSFVSILVLIFLPLSVTVDEINKQSDMNYAEFQLDK